MSLIAQPGEEAADSAHSGSDAEWQRIEITGGSCHAHHLLDGFDEDQSAEQCADNRFARECGPACAQEPRRFECREKAASDGRAENSCADCEPSIRSRHGIAQASPLPPEDLTASEITGSFENQMESRRTQRHFSKSISGQNTTLLVE